MKKALLVGTAVLLLLASAAAVSLSGTTVTYILPAPGILTEENGTAAKKAALSVKGVASAEAFVETRTIEVELLDASLSVKKVVRAINKAGYTVGKPRVKGPDRK